MRAEALCSCHQTRGRVHPGWVTSASQGHTETNTHACSHSLRESIYNHHFNLTCMFSDGVRNLRTHEYTGRTCKSHTERTQSGFKPGTLLRWGNSANHHTFITFVIHWNTQLVYQMLRIQLLYVHLLQHCDIIMSNFCGVTVLKWQDFPNEWK